MASPAEAFLSTVIDVIATILISYGYLTCLSMIGILLEVKSLYLSDLSVFEEETEEPKVKSTHSLGSVNWPITRIKWPVTKSYALADYDQRLFPLFKRLCFIFVLLFYSFSNLFPVFTLNHCTAVAAAFFVFDFYLSFKDHTLLKLGLMMFLWAFSPVVLFYILYKLAENRPDLRRNEDNYADCGNHENKAKDKEDADTDEN